MTGLRIAVLMTCHNRKASTLACLDALFHQVLIESVSLDVFLVDDGSTDDTGKSVKEHFPRVTVIKGDGSLYWCGGMRVAWKAALEHAPHDYFLLLNDDTLLKEDAVAGMVRTATNHFGIIVGSCHDPIAGNWTYGGRSAKGGRKSLAGTPVLPNGQVQKCQLMNGNVVLVSNKVVGMLGIFADSYTHAIGDIDYGFRALDKDIPLLVPPAYQATCIKNPLPSWCDPGTPFRKRAALFNGPKGIHFSEFILFCYRHFGLKSIWIGCKVVARLFFPALWIQNSSINK